LSSEYDGMSGPERQVATFLSNLGLWWRYEAPVFVFDKKERPRVWTPDFYLPKLGIYIEVCGSEDIDYFYREDIYEKNNLKVIFIHYYKSQKWQKFLLERIMQIEDSRNRKIMEIIRSLRQALTRVKLDKTEQDGAS